MARYLLVNFLLELPLVFTFFPGIGAIYAEMVQNILGPLIESKTTQVVRYDVHHALPNTANALIGKFH